MPHTIHHFWISQFSPTSVLLSHGFGTIKWAQHYSKSCVQTEPKSLCSRGIIVLHCTENGEVTHLKRFRWNTWYQSYNISTYPLHIKYQIRFTFIHWRCHHNKNPNTDSWTENFPRPVLKISSPVILIKFPHYLMFRCNCFVNSLIQHIVFTNSWKLKSTLPSKYDVIYR